MRWKKTTIDFDSNTYITKNYIKNNKAVISLNIKDNDVFYNELDANRLTLSIHMVNIIQTLIEDIPYKYEIIMKLYCPKMTKEEQLKAESVIKTYYGLDARLGNKELELNKIKAVALFIVGVFFLFLSSSLSPFGYLVKEVLSIAGWVAIWETVNVILLETIRIKLYKLNLTRLYNSTIEFITRE